MIEFWSDVVVFVALLWAAAHVGLVILRSVIKKELPKRVLVVEEYKDSDELTESDESITDVRDSWLEPDVDLKITSKYFNKATRYVARCELCFFKMKALAIVNTPASTSCPGCLIGDLKITVICRGLDYDE